MAIQVPQLKRFDDQPTASVGRLQVDVPDSVKAIAPQEQAIGKAVDKAQEYFQKEEDHAIETMANQDAFNYHGSLEGNLEAAQKSGGDPTQIYADLDKKNAEARQSVLDSRPDASPRAKAQIAQKLGEMDDRYYAKKTVAQSSQQYTFDNHLTDNMAKVSQAAISDATRLIDINNPDTLEPINTEIEKISNVYFKNGEKYGLVTRDADGHPLTNPSVDVKTRKAISDGLSQAILNLTNSGETEKAQMVQEKFGKYIDAKADARINASTQRALNEKAVYSVYDQARTATVQGKDGLKIIEESNLGLKQKEDARKLFHADLSRQKTDQDNKSKMNANQILNLVEKREQDGKPFKNDADLRHDPVVKLLLENVTNAKERDALFARFDSPKVSKTQAMAKAYEVMHDPEHTGGFEKIEQMEFEELMIGISKSDKTMFRNAYNKAHDPDSAGEIQRIKFAGNTVKDTMLAKGLVDRNQYLKLDDEALRKVIEAQREYDLRLRNFPKNMSNFDIQTDIEKFVMAKKLKSTFTAPPTYTKKTFNGTGVMRDAQHGAPQPAATPRPKTAKELRPDDRMKLKKAYKEGPGKGSFPNENQLESFYQNQGK